MIISLSTVNSILRTEDIEGLIALGSPADEYAAEAKEIQARLGSLAPDQWTSARVSGLVWDVWGRAFGLFSEDDLQRRRPVLEQVVQRIMAERLPSTATAQAHLTSGGRLQ